jgi:hypothetical protein
MAILGAHQSIAELASVEAESDVETWSAIGGYFFAIALVIVYDTATL